ncbi:DMT family transporter [Palleronia sp. LCG004]|uniref:DMT family transporter n=1 Tax=Palleronia sp. LCG004 TaxID=3079304 RepID=UPI002943E639|nr:DMT family transporter [Palleronia sp. LCG004]WOI56648.1 DMT family transporter [Palleronia sp. LCG004]
MSGTHASDNLRGSLFMVIAMLAFAVEDVFFKSATMRVAPGLATLIFGLFGFSCFAVMVTLSGGPFLTRAFLSRAMFWRSVCEVAGRLFYALALAFVPLSATAAILQAAPLVVTLGAVVFLGERVGWGRWIAMGVGFAGVLVVLKPFGADFSPALLFAVAGTLGFAARDVATRASSPTLSTGHLGLAGFTMTIIAGLVIMAVEPAGPAPDAGALFRLVSAGIAGVAAYWALTRAMRLGEISVVAPFRYSRLLFAIGLAALVFGERPDLSTLAGGVLIVGSGIYTLVRSGREKRA